MKMWKVFCMQTLYGSIWHENVESVPYALCMVLAGMKIWKAFCTQTLYGCFIWHENMETVLWA